MLIHLWYNKFIARVQGEEMSENVLNLKYTVEIRKTEHEEWEERARTYFMDWAIITAKQFVNMGTPHVRIGEIEIHMKREWNHGDELI